MVKDIQDACKLFEPIYDETEAGDGYVSVEVSPRLADDTEGTIEAAKWLHKKVDRRNVYIKIPATAPCIPSIKEVIANGISVNVTVSVFCFAYSFDIVEKSIVVKVKCEHSFSQTFQIIELVCKGISEALHYSSRLVT